MYLTKCSNPFTMLVALSSLWGVYQLSFTHNPLLPCAPAVGGRTWYDYITFLMGLFRSKIRTFMPPAVPRGKLPFTAFFFFRSTSMSPLSPLFFLCLSSAHTEPDVCDYEISSQLCERPGVSWSKFNQRLSVKKHVLDLTHLVSFEQILSDLDLSVASVHVSWVSLQQ